VTDDEVLARRTRHLSTQARLPGRAYDHDEVGFNYRLSNLAAALGVAQLEQLPELLSARRLIAQRYDAELARLSGLLPAPRAPWADPSFWLYTAAVDSQRTTVHRDSLIDALAAEGVEARPIWTPLHRTKLYADAPRLGGAVADRIFDRAFSLPSSSSLPLADQARVVETLREALEPAVA